LNAYYEVGKEGRFTNIGGKAGRAILSRDLKAVSYESYAQITRRLLRNLNGTVGFEGVNTTRLIEQRFPTFDRQALRFANLSPQVNLRYRADNWSASEISLTVSRSFEPPTFSELSGGNVPGFTRFKAQTGTTLEAGFVWADPTAPVKISANLYNMRLRNEFIVTALADGGSKTVNGNFTRHAGLELGLKSNPWSGIFNRVDEAQFTATYSLNDFRFDKDDVYGNGPLAGIPRDYLKLNVTYRPAPGLSLSFPAEVSPTPYFIDMKAKLKTRPYSILGFRLDWSAPGTPYGLYADFKNITDEHYTATTNIVADSNGVDGRYFYPGEGRAVYIGIRMQP